MHLGYSCPISVPQFAAFSLIININNDAINHRIVNENAERKKKDNTQSRTGGGGNEHFDFMMHREMLLVASPMCTTPQHTATSNLSELHKFLITKMTKNETTKDQNEQSSAFTYNTDGVQIYRSKHGLCLYHKVIQDPVQIGEFSSFLSSMQIFNIPNHVAAIVLSAGFTGIPIIHGSSNLINNISKHFCQTLLSLTKLAHKLKSQRQAQSSNNKSNNNNYANSNLDINEDDLKQKAKSILYRILLEEDDLLSNTEASTNFDSSISDFAELPVYSKLTPPPLASARLSQHNSSQASLSLPSSSSFKRKLHSSEMTAVAQSTLMMSQMQILAISERDMDLKPDRRINRTKNATTEDQSFASGASSVLPELIGFDMPYSFEETNADNPWRSNKNKNQTSFLNSKNSKPTITLTLPPPRRSSIRSRVRSTQSSQRMNKIKSPPDISRQFIKNKSESVSHSVSSTSSSHQYLEKKNNFKKRVENTDTSTLHSRKNAAAISSQQIDTTIRNSVNHIQKDFRQSFQISERNTPTPQPIPDWADLNFNKFSNSIDTSNENSNFKNQPVASAWQWQNFGDNSEDIRFSEKDKLISKSIHTNNTGTALHNSNNYNMNDNEHNFNNSAGEIEYGTEKTVASGKEEYDDPSISTVDTATPSDGSAVPFPTLLLNCVLNEDLICSYESGRFSSLSIEGTIQVQTTSDTPTSASKPFVLAIKDTFQHLKSFELSKYAKEDISEKRKKYEASNNEAFRFLVNIPDKSNDFFTILRYKCSRELRPVPIRVQTKTRIEGSFCRVDLQISSNPANEDELSDLTILMPVPEMLKGETLVTSPTGGVWNAATRNVLWRVAELGHGEKFHLQAQFEMFSKEECDELGLILDVPTFPVSVRCQCLHSQLSDIELDAYDASEVYPMEVSMSLLRRFKLLHREKI